MRLLDPEIRSHINIVFLENLLMDSAKVGRITVPGNAAEMLRAAGFNTAMCGFSGIWGHEAGGITETADMLKKQRINPVGIRTTENGNTFIIQEENGVRVALLGYTTMLKATTRTTMAKKGFGYMVPGAEAEGIAADIARVRAEGAQAVIVLMNWGSPGDKNPTKNQMALAQQIADAGADFIIGAGSRVPQRVEYLTRADGRQVFCAYSLGTLISDSRSPANRVGGYLLHVTASLDAEGNARAIEVYYTPTYVWKYRQDGKDYYRCVAANREAPDGMDQDQVNAMHKTLEAVQKALEGCPLLPSP